MEEPQTKKAGKVIRIISILTIVGVIIAAMVIGLSHNTAEAHKVWDEATSIGNPEAKNHFIIYSDIVCPYCVAFENAIVEHEEEFKKYIEENDILVEIRISDFLYEYGQSNPISSRYSAEATYCAKKEGKFWDYYNKVISYVWSNYFAISGKNAFTELNSKSKDFWIEIGKKAGLGEDFTKCVKNGDTLDELSAVSDKMAKQIDGLPYFKFNKYISSGFDLSWGWEYVKMYFESGLKSN